MATNIIALLSASLFAGAALYISLVEHPARLSLADAPLLAQWQPSYKKALPIQAGLAILGGIAGLAAAGASGESLYLVGALLMLANWPFTYFAIMPTNRKLLGMVPERDAGAESRSMLLFWGTRHHVRSALGTAATLAFALAIAA